MKVGITLPQFRPAAEPAMAAARAAETSGLDGVFVFDHLWAIGNPSRVALSCFPLMGALAVETDRVSIGTLVARVGVLAPAVIEHNFATLQRMAGPRLIAGLGMGDQLSAPENEALGIEFPPPAERREMLVDVCRRVRALGITTWVGGRSATTQAVGRREADGINLWDAPEDEVAQLVVGGEVTWGGQVPADRPGVIDRLSALRDAGASWAICAPRFGPDPVPAVEMVAEAVRALT
jgi:alkanesulfonate monooxygenase SsuD/methylene tetrahydromethanopterin reductase-like flavin-dependent oxidoreductase (luciferase family)